MHLKFLVCLSVEAFFVGINRLFLCLPEQFHFFAKSKLFLKMMMTRIHLLEGMYSSLLNRAIDCFLFDFWLKISIRIDAKWLPCIYKRYILKYWCILRCLRISLKETCPMIDLYEKKCGMFWTNIQEELLDSQCNSKVICSDTADYSREIWLVKDQLKHYQEEKIRDEWLQCSHSEKLHLIDFYQIK